MDWRRACELSTTGIAAAMVLGGLGGVAAGDDAALSERWRWAGFGPDTGLPAARASEVAEVVNDEAWLATPSGVFV